MDQHPVRTADQAAADTGAEIFVELPQPQASRSLDSDSLLSEDDKAVIRWNGEGGGNPDYDPAKWGRGA